MKSRATRHAAAAAVVALVTTCSLTGCGGSADQTPSITDPKDLLEDVALKYDSHGPGTKPKQVRITQGQMVFVAVLSDVPGTVSVEGYNVTHDVRADEVGTLVISADDAGTFDVTLKGQGVDTQLAELEVAR